MGAKQKLNGANILAAVVVALLAGAATESVSVFFVILIGILVASKIAGDIR